jgi:hypothetical protein
MNGGAGIMIDKLVRTPRNIALVLLYIACFWLYTQAASLASPLPREELVSLNGASRLQLPDAFRGKRVLLAVGFHPRHQSTLEKGVLLFDGLRATGANVQVLEVAVLDTKYKSFKPSVEAFMRKAVNEKPLMGRIYPMYTNSQAFKKSLGLQQEEYAFILLGPEGQVLWKKSAAPTASMVDSVKRLIP